LEPWQREGVNGALAKGASPLPPLTRGVWGICVVKHPTDPCGRVQPTLNQQHHICRYQEEAGKGLPPPRRGRLGGGVSQRRNVYAGAKNSAFAETPLPALPCKGGGDLELFSSCLKQSDVLCMGREPPGIVASLDCIRVKTENTQQNYILEPEAVNSQNSRSSQMNSSCRNGFRWGIWGCRGLSR
jgi:hypothetical protein